jgi:transmembrane sensor
MNGESHRDGPEPRIDLAAAEWLVRRDRGFTAEEQDEFFHWLAEDPRHGEWLSIHHQTWRDFNLLAEWRPKHSSEPNPDLLARRHASHRWLWPAAAALAAGSALTLTLWHPGVKPTTDWTALTAASAIQHRVLADDSEVELNRGAVIEVDFTPTERNVRLVRGEAHFAVAKNPLRPFIVRANGVKVRAVGTAFDMRLDAESVEVLVTEGHVQVQPPMASVPVLAAGQRTVVSFSPTAPPPQVLEVPPEEMAQRLAWQPQLLDFSSTPLAKVVAEFNRHSAGSSGMKLVIADPELGRLPIVASIRSDNIEGLVRLLELTAGVRAERRGNNEIVLHKAQ